MTTKFLYTVSAKGFIFLSAFSLLYVAVLALLSPQSVMDLVQVKLENTDAISSIRGIYGGVGITLCSTIIYMGLYNIEKGLLFLTMFWGSYSLSRIITHITEGALGDFGTQWLWIETIFCVIGLTLLIFGKKIKAQVHEGN